MKKKALRFTLLFLFAISLIFLVACSRKEAPPLTSSQQSADNSEHYIDKIEQYSALLTEVQNELEHQKEQNYIDACEYESKIKELEQMLVSIESGQASSPVQNLENKQKPASNDFKYTVKDGNATILLYSGSMSAVSVPDIIGGYPVVKIGEEAFKNTSVVSVTIPDTVKEIDWFAFYGCTSLKEITIPSSVISVGYGAFDYCTSNPVIICQKGSYIEAYAASWGMRFISK